MVTVRIHIEGGGQTGPLREACRRAFTEFFRKAGLAGRMPKVVACGSRQRALDSFLGAIGASKQGFFEVLLVDSEEEVVQGATAWNHLKQRDSWDRPEGVEDESAQLMVQCMEAWFLADRETLKTYFGNGFNESKLPTSSKIDEVPKSRVFESLKQATRDTKTKGAYDKGEHSFRILEKLNADKVITASSHAAKLIEILKERTR